MVGLCHTIPHRAGNHDDYIYILQSGMSSPVSVMADVYLGPVFGRSVLDNYCSMQLNCIVHKSLAGR